MSSLINFILDNVDLSEREQKQEATMFKAYASSDASLKNEHAEERDNAAPIEVSTLNNNNNNSTSGK